MGKRFRDFMSVVAVAASCTTLASAAWAGEIVSDPDQAGPETVEEAFDRIYYDNGGTFFENRRPQSTINLVFGPGSLIRNSFPENQIIRDARQVNLFYRDLLEQQVASDPVIRTPDLPNPYSTSVLLLPPFDVNRPLTGSLPARGEFVFETVPLR